MEQARIFSMPLADVYPLYVNKAQRKGRSKAEVDEIICWLTGYDLETLQDRIGSRTSFEAFFAEAPRMNPDRKLIKGVICGIRVEDMDEGLMQEIRFLDKLIDELAKGKAMERILRA